MQICFGTVISLSRLSRYLVYRLSRLSVCLVYRLSCLSCLLSCLSFVLLSFISFYRLSFICYRLSVLVPFILYTVILLFHSAGCKSV